jgi:hypothetical protein
MMEVGPGTAAGELLGYIISIGIRAKPQGVRAIVITERCVAVTQRLPFFGNWVGVDYLGTGSTATDAEKAKTVDRACKLLAKGPEELVLKEDVLQVLFKKPGVNDGHVIFKRTKGNVALQIYGTLRYRSASPKQVRGLMSALIEFAPDKLYNEDSGNLIVDDLKNGKDYL